MKRTLVSLIAAITLLSTAHVQPYRDDFDGGFALNWSWKLPQNDPLCTLFDNAAFINAEESVLVIQMRDGGMFSNFNTHKNVPTLRIVGAPPDDWYIETSLRAADWNQVPYCQWCYPQAGILIATGAKNYFQQLVTRDGNNGLPDVYASANWERDDQFEWAYRVSQSWIPDDGWIKLRIEHVPDPNNPYIVLTYAHSGTNGLTEYDGFNGARYYSIEDAELYNWIVGLLTTPGARIGLYTDNAGTGSQAAFWFNYLETNIPVAPVGDVNTDGIVDDADLLAVLFNFGTEGECQDEDVTNDGVVDDADLLTVLFNFGSGG
ncbi:MAG: hypothetical protein CFK49_01605 [Armatimonadetes bacterium JP3_11]|jgi:hypothetical protein|nr:MAG: hypothetical protein CFK48_06005 [Armatimonadetes bacterium CP1_7O]OYT75721.1 MAG: hypothetical protein CFK49_01605 [Armatimonadetes bacterium JP3_11]RMH09491.1 MAG: hypothetical protein D6697_03590 [Armatimonadota bacterium]